MNAMIDAEEKGGHHVIGCEKLAAVIKSAQRALSIAPSATARCDEGDR